MKIVVTGCSGFIGSHIVRELLKKNHDVLGIALPGDSLYRLSDTQKLLEILQCDIGKISNYRERFLKWEPEICIHLAWYAEPGKYLSSYKNLDSLSGSLLLHQLMLESGCKHMVSAGTCAEYDLSKNTIIDEDTLVNPSSLYASSKFAQKVVSEQLAKLSGTKFSWGRIFYLYGPFEDERRLIPSAIRALRLKNEFPITSGNQIRDYLHVEDVASAFVRIAETGSEGTFNISSGVPVSIRNILEMLVKLIKSDPSLLKFGQIPLNENDPMFICSKNNRLRDIGWQPEYDLESGLHQVINWITTYKN